MLQFLQQLWTAVTKTWDLWHPKIPTLFMTDITTLTAQVSLVGSLLISLGMLILRVWKIVSKLSVKFWRLKQSVLESYTLGKRLTAAMQTQDANKIFEALAHIEMRAVEHINKQCK